MDLQSLGDKIIQQIQCWSYLSWTWDYFLKVTSIRVDWSAIQPVNDILLELDFFPVQEAYMALCQSPPWNCYQSRVPRILKSYNYWVLVDRQLNFLFYSLRLDFTVWYTCLPYFHTRLNHKLSPLWEKQWVFRGGISSPSESTNFPYPEITIV